jgi:hypothetical protein
MNPHHSPNELTSDSAASNPLPMRISKGSAIGYGVWLFGTFLFTLVVLFDCLVGTKLPGGVIYFVFVLGPILGICGAAATNHGTLGKISLILTTLCFLPIQFIIIGMVLIATTGLEGTQ